MSETQVIRVRYWAAARAAAGVAEEDVEVSGTTTLTALRDLVVSRHPEPRFPDVVKSCSVLIGDRPVASADPDTVLVEPGDQVEFLPPFAGG